MDKLPVGVDPIGGLKDAFWFVADDADPAVGFRPDGLFYSDLPEQMPKSFDQPGKWHLTRWGTVTKDLVAAHQRGRHGVIQREVVAADKRRKAA